ncbi:MAG: hypothetical protein MJZ71_06920 [Bacteroidales bacterium]|nr:hypothetical protein [Bacteroidales bacterium]
MEYTTVQMEEQKTMEDVIKLTPSLKNEFLTTIKLGKYLGIMGFIMSGLLLLFAIAFLLFPSPEALDPEMEGLAEGFFKAGMIISAVFMTICTVVTFLITYTLFSGCKKLEQAVQSNNQEYYLIGFHKVKTCLQIYGVIMGISVFLTGISVFTTLVSRILVG